MNFTTKTLTYARVISFTVNYCLFANSDFSIRFNGKDDIVVLEYTCGHNTLYYMTVSTGKQRHHMINYIVGPENGTVIHVYM